MLSTEYENAKRVCVESGTLWEDPDFTATQTSVFYHQTPPFNFEWKRPGEIFSDPQFVRQNCNFFDVETGKLGDKWLVSCLGVVFQSRPMFQKLIQIDQISESVYTGIYRFRLWWCGRWQEVVVDDRLPTVNGKLAFIQTTYSQQLWPSLLEKAYAKLHGSYEALKYENMMNGMADFLGGVTETYFVANFVNPEALLLELQSASLVTAHCAHLQDADGLSESRIENDMSYRICDVVKREDNQAARRTVQQNNVDLYNYKVKFCLPPYPDSDSASPLSPYRTRSSAAMHQGSDNVFVTIDYHKFLKIFSRIEIVHLGGTDVGDLRDKQLWQMRMHNGNWRRGVSAGGCRNPGNFFHLNPQVKIVLDESDTVVISLSQQSISDAKIIGFSVMKVPMAVDKTICQEFLGSLRIVANSQYSNNRQISCRMDLTSGSYVVIPTTFEARKEGDFSLRIFSHNHLVMNVLDFEPKMHREAILKAPENADTAGVFQYEGVFMQLADEHKRIDVFELQELLERCLPNDYIKSCSTLDTCKQIVLTMDKTESGRITWDDFKDLMCSLRGWQAVYRKHTRGTPAVLRAELLRDALRDVAFEVPNRTIALLLARYMRKDGMLRFGDFVAAIMRLHQIFHAFEALKPQLNRSKLKLSDWLKNSVMF